MKLSHGFTKHDTNITRHFSHKKVCYPLHTLHTVVCKLLANFYSILEFSTHKKSWYSIIFT